MTPPQTFTTVSLLLIAAMVVATSLTQSFFYHDAIINSEAAIIHDMLEALTREQENEHMLSPWDLQHYADATAQEHLQHSFVSLTNMPGVALIKVFNTDRTIAWSDRPGLIGTKLTTHSEDLARALDGELRPVLNSREYGVVEIFRGKTLIEFYVPFTLGNLASANGKASGVLAIYLSQESVSQAIRRGTLLQWLVTGLGGLLLYAALYRLFRSVYYKQREAESRFLKLSTEHERIMQIEKLSAMGQMVSEIAHQLNNPLVGVINLTELAERELGNPQRVKELLGEVRRAGDHCYGFVQRMLVINRATHSEPQLTDMNRLVRDTIAFFHQSLGGHPPVIFEESDQPVTMTVDPVLIRNTLFNLIHNAAQADPIGPVVVSLAPDERDGVPGCRLTVSDNGSGLSSEVTAKLFTPFFTTRPGGTGLGLSIAQHIAVQHGGNIHAENKPGGGARFIIWLPEKKANA